MRTHRFGMLTFAFAGTLLALAASLHGQEPRLAMGPQAGDSQTPSMTKFYGGTHAPTGTFPGTLVCLRCDMTQSPGRAERCAEEGHRHALSMQDGSMIHPLLAGTEEMVNQINAAELHGKKVEVEGRHYVTTGTILVSRITVVE